MAPWKAPRVNRRSLGLLHRLLCLFQLRRLLSGFTFANHTASIRASLYSASCTAFCASSNFVASASVTVAFLATSSSLTSTSASAEAGGRGKGGSACGKGEGAEQRLAQVEAVLLAKVEGGKQTTKMEDAQKAERPPVHPQSLPGNHTYSASVEASAAPCAGTRSASFTSVSSTITCS